MRSRLVLALMLVAPCVLACTPQGTARAGAPDAGFDSKLLVDSSTAPPAPTTPDAGADEQLPASASEDLTTRAKHLLEAVKHDDPTLAADILFPRDAYLLVKDTGDPGKQWDTKVTTLFQRQVHALHKRLKGIERAQFVSFEIGEPVVQALPRKRDLKRTLWRVRHSRLTYTIDGKALHIDMSDMLSWKGAWYVLKLKGNV